MAINSSLAMANESQVDAHYTKSPANDNVNAVDVQDMSIATLGANSSSPTCSMAVARTVYSKAKLHGSASFEDAAAQVLSKDADCVLVPGAYPDIRKFFMHEDLIVIDVFHSDIPALVLVKQPEQSTEVGPLFYHPATLSLLPNIQISFRNSIPCSSNEVTVERLRASVEPAAAVTNQLAADAAGLPVCQVLRVAKPMTWTLFARISNK